MLQPKLRDTKMIGYEFTNKKLDGSKLKILFLGKHIKLFHCHGKHQLFEDADDDIEEVEDEDNEEHEEDPRSEDG